MESTEGADQIDDAMVDMMAKGLTLGRIAAKVGLPVPVCHERIQARLESMDSNMSMVQMRMLQLHRLQLVMPRLFEMAEDQVHGAESLAQSKNIKTLIELIREVTDLMDLKKDRLREEQVRLTQAQTQMILTCVDFLRVQMLQKVKEALATGGGFDAVESIWESAFSEAAATAIESNSAAVVQVGKGAGPIELAPVPS